MISRRRPVPLFQPGELVRHRRYGYRGVVVEIDEVCQADDQWYGSNQTQPDREQPWYHVLVDGGSSVTYAAQESLEADSLGKPIEHPLLAQLFHGFIDGHYVRSNTAWPGW